MHVQVSLTFRTSHHVHIRLSQWSLIVLDIQEFFKILVLQLALFPIVNNVSFFSLVSPMVDDSNKRFKSNFTHHDGAPVWIIEESLPVQPLEAPVEDKPGKLNIEDHMGEELDQMLCLIANIDIPGTTLIWDDYQGWEVHLPVEPVDIPERITLVMEQDDGEMAEMPPVKYFDENGLPVYEFRDPKTGHIYWDQCECADCYEDCLKNNNGMTPQELKEQHEKEHPEDKGKGKADEAGPSSAPPPNE